MYCLKFKYTRKYFNRSTIFFIKISNILQFKNFKDKYAEIKSKTKAINDSINVIMNEIFKKSRSSKICFYFFIICCFLIKQQYHFINLKF